MEKKKDIYSLYGDEYRSSYFKGLKGLSFEARKAYEDENKLYLDGKTDEQKDFEFRIDLLGRELESHSDPRVAALWTNRRTELDTEEKRNRVWSQIALEKDLDGKSDDADKGASFRDWLVWFADLNRQSNELKTGSAFHRSKEEREELAKASDDLFINKRIKLDESTTARNQARQYLNKQADNNYDQLMGAYNNMSWGDQQRAKDAIIDLSESVSPNYYARFKDSHTLPPGFMDELTVKYFAWETAGGSQFANGQLAEFWQNYFARQQTQGEKWANAGAKFGAEVASTGIMFGGLLYGLATSDGKILSGDYWKGVIDNDVTRYGADLFTTGQWSKALQEEYKAKGWDKHAILNTVDQERSLLSANTPAELFAQYGFTAASMLLSGGLSASFKGIAKASVKAVAKSGLKATAAGRNITKGILATNRIAQTTVPLLVAAPEATLEAITTKDEAMEAGKRNIEDTINKQIDQDILDWINNNPTVAETRIKNNPEYQNLNFTFGKLVPNKELGISQKQYSDLDKQRMFTLLREDPGIRAQYNEKYKAYSEGMLKQLEDTETTMVLTTAAANMILLGALNSTWQATQQALGVRRALGKQSSKRLANAVDIVADSNGRQFKALAKNVTKGDIFKDRVKEAFSEGVEEISQSGISSFSQGMSDSKVDQYFNYRYNNANKDSAVDAFSTDFWEMMSAGLSSAGKKMLSKEGFKEGLYGTLSTLLGGPSVNFNMSFGGRREGESFVDVVNRNSPIAWRGVTELAFSSAEQNARNKENQDVANALNNFFSDEQKSQLFFDAVASLEASKAFNDAITVGDEKKARDSKVDVLFNASSMISSMRGTAFYDVVLKTLSERTKFDINNISDEASNEAIAIEEFRLKTGSKESDEAILEEIKESAQTMLYVIDFAEKETARVRKVFGDDVSIDVVNSLVSNSLHIADTERRIKLIEDTLKARDFSPAEGSNVSSPHSKAVKQMFARWGTSQEATKRQLSLKSKAESLIEQIAEYKKSLKGKTSRGAIKEAVRPFELMLAETEREIAEIEKYAEISANLGEEEIILSAQDIADLDTKSRHALLNAENRSRSLSKVQQAEIETFYKRGTWGDPNFKQRIEDLNTLQNSLESYRNEEFHYLENPRALITKAERLRKEAARNLVMKKYEYLKDESSEANASYENFKKAYLKALKEATKEEEIAAINTTVKNNKHYATFRQEDKAFNTFMSKIEKLSRYNSYDPSTRTVLNSVFMYLFMEGVEFSNTSEVKRRLNDIYPSVADDAGEIRFREILVENQLPFSEEHSPRAAVYTAIQLVHEIQKQEEEIASRPVTKPQDEETGKPATPVASPKTQKTAAPVFRSNTVNKIIESLRVKHSGNSALLGVLNQIEDIVRGFREETMVEDLNKAIRESKNNDIKDALVYIRNILMAGVDVHTETKSIVTATPNPEAGEIESFSTSDLESMKESLGGEKTKATLSRIYEFLNSPEKYAVMRQIQQSGKAIKFYIPSELEQEVKDNLGEKYVAEIHAPVVILMPYENGSVTLNGKKYQPIGFLPASNNTKKSGSANTYSIRRSLINNDGTIKTDTISPIQSNSWQIPGKAPEHIDASSKDTNVRDLIGDENGITIEGFIDAMSIQKPEVVLGEESKGRPKIVVNIPNFKKNGSTTPIDVFVTKAQDVRDEEGKNLFDYLVEGNLEKALNFNWRIKQVADIFTAVLGDKRYETADENALREASNFINDTLSKYIRFSGGTFKLGFKSEQQQDGSTKVALTLGISSSRQVTILDDITNVTTEEKPQSILTLLQNLLLNNEHTGPKSLSSTGQFLIYQVNYSSIEEATTEDSTLSSNIFKNAAADQRRKMAKKAAIKKDIEAGLFSVSKNSLHYRAEGIKFSLPVTAAKESNTSSTFPAATTYVTPQPIESPIQPAETSDGKVVEATTGEVATEAPAAPEVAETTESAEVKEETSKVESKEESKPTRKPRSRNYSGDFASIGTKQIKRTDRSIVKAEDLRSRLSREGITAEMWDSMTPVEKQQIIDCC